MATPRSAIQLLSPRKSNSFNSLDRKFMADAAQLIIEDQLQNLN